MQRSLQQIVKTEAVAENGMVTAMHPLAAEAGIELLRAGGNAADAAIATALAVGVVEPFMSGLGGCAYAVVYDAARQRTVCFDGSALVPRDAHEDMFELEEAHTQSLGLYGWRATRDNASESGYRSIAIPGAVASLAKLHAHLATKSWDEIAAPAVRLAKEGFPVDEYLFAQSASSVSQLRAFPETMAVFYHSDGTAKVPSFHGADPERLRQPALAGTLETLARTGPESFYSGTIAESIVRHVREHGGILSLDDLARYEARTLEPLTIRYRDHRIALLPQASGGTTVAYMLNLLRAFGLHRLPSESAERIHIVSEAIRLGFHDRFAFLGDSDAVPVPLSGLLSEDYARTRRELIDPDGPRLEVLPPGDPWACQEGAAAGDSRPGTGDASGQHTTHLNACDRDGNMVALTATLGARFGSGVTVPDLGVVLNNGMMWFDPEPGHLSSIAPGKRALHAAAPCLLFRDEDPIAALGSPGARKIMSAVLQVVLNLLDHEMGIQDAILAPRVHCEATPPLLADARLPQAVLDELRRRRHQVTPETESFLSSFFGRPSGILRDLDRGVLRGGVEPYRVSAAIGY